MKITQFDKSPTIKQIQESVTPIIEDADQVPEPGQVIRTKKSQIEGKVEKIGRNNEVFFRLADGRLMKTAIENVIVIEKLADEDEEIMENELDEVSNELLSKYRTAAGKDATAADKKGNYEKGTKRFKGIVKATNKQFSNDARKTTEGTMGGISRCAPAYDVSHQDELDDVYDTWKGDTTKVKETGSYADRLTSILEAGFEDILNQQHNEKPKAKVVDIPFHGWTIRYRPSDTPGNPVPWMVLDRKNIEKNRGKALSDTEAVGAAEEWIKSGGGTITQTSSSVTVDFNRSFMTQFTPTGETFYTKVVADGDTPVLMLSYDPLPGFKTSHLSPRKPQPVIALSAQDCNNAKLQPNGRYVLGRESKEDGISKFPLILQSISQSSTDKIQMKEPGLTIAAKRNTETGIVNEISKSTLGSYVKKAAFDVADRANMAGWKAGTVNSKYNTSDEAPRELQRQKGIERAVDRLANSNQLSKSKQMPKSRYSVDDAEDVDYRNT